MIHNSNSIDYFKNDICKTLFERRIYLDLDFLKNIGGKEKNFDINMFREELANKLKEMEKKYTIDRFEGNIAI